MFESSGEEIGDRIAPAALRRREGMPAEGGRQDHSTSEWSCGDRRVISCCVST